jgi:hypothetical protein
VLLADESVVLILDDTEHVWDKHRANLIQVRPVRPTGGGALTQGLSVRGLAAAAAVFVAVASLAVHRTARIKAVLIIYHTSAFSALSVGWRMDK